MYSLMNTKQYIKFMIIVGNGTEHSPLSNEQRIMPKESQVMELRIGQRLREKHNHTRKVTVVYVTDPGTYVCVETAYGSLDVLVLFDGVWRDIEKGDHIADYWELIE